MKIPARAIVLTALIITVLAVLVVALPRILPADRGVALQDLPQFYPPESKALGVVVIKTYREYRGNAVRWSGVYFTCLFGSALLSALAGLVLKLEMLQAWPRLRNDFAATAAMIAALLVTLSTTGDFQRKWQANRIAAAAMENLAYKLVTVKSEADRHAIIDEIQSINDARNRGIVGEQIPRGPVEKSPHQPGSDHDSAADVPQATHH
jgi:hypothetical protein